ncbi:asparagine synthetase B family protein [Lentisalinibacter sediminis]|uniref:hypothetical protein n=1 Tax=Lentisalinibacter sediminis TaxID=2992237 RepID=UPI003868E88B
MSFIFVSGGASSLSRFHHAELSYTREFTEAWSDGTCALFVRRDGGTSVWDLPGYFAVTDGERVDGISQGVHALESGDAEPLSRMIRGNAVAISKHTGYAWVLSDTLGSFPFFYGDSQDRGFRAYSPIQGDLRWLLDCQPDFTGVYQFLGGGYTIGRRTVCRGMYQFLPGESHIIEPGRSAVEAVIKVLPNPWATEKRVHLDSCATKAIHAVTLEGRRLVGCQVMFSAGWDSRTILAGILANGLEDEVLAYSHGDTSSRELRIADRICRDHGVLSYSRELAELEIDVALLERALEDSGHSLFPHWRLASEFARERGLRSLSGGIFGGVLGGHYGVPSIVQGQRAQLTSLLKYLYGPKPSSNTGARALDTAFKLLHRPSYIDWWCLDSGVREEIRRQVITDCAVDTKSELQRLAESGVTNLDSLVEAFQVGHRGRQYMNGQLGICRSVIPIVNPFSNDELVSLACALPLRCKIHNKVNQELLRRMAPSLLRYPMAATLLSAAWPIGMQELSRGGRKVAESVRWRLYRATGGVSARHPNMGWVNFDFLRTGTLLHDIVDSLLADFWDKATMHRTISEHPLTSLHPLYDMLCKIKTIDHRLNHSR